MTLSRADGSMTLGRGVDISLLTSSVLFRPLLMLLQVVVAEVVVVVVITPGGRLAVRQQYPDIVTASGGLKLRTSNLINNLIFIMHTHIQWYKI